jgi:hypothetical protein
MDWPNNLCAGYMQGEWGLLLSVCSVNVDNVVLVDMPFSSSFDKVVLITMPRMTRICRYSQSTHQLRLKELHLLIWRTELSSMVLSCLHTPYELGHR